MAKVPGWIDPTRLPQSFCRLSVYEGALFMGTRAVIPPSPRSSVLKMLPEGHPGATRTKMLAQRYVYWQGIDRAIEDRVKLSNAC